MREIKFRGKSDNDWAYGYLLKVDEINQAEHEHFNYFIQSDFIQLEEYVEYYITDDNTIGQFTGLHDKNGKEIYEGDIVKIHKHSYDFGFKQDEIGQIKFIDGAFGFYREKNEKEYYFNDLATENGYGELDYYEVIGNIWDDSDLLNDSLVVY